MKMKPAKRFLAAAVMLCLLLTSCTGVLAAERPHDELQYTGVTNIVASLNISSSGRATCNGQALVYDGYSADVTVELKQDGETIYTWSDSGDGPAVVGAGGPRYVLSGYDYLVTTTVTVWTSSGTLVSTITKNSNGVSY